MKILIIEDNETDAEMVARWLNTLGREIVIAKTMAEAWSVIRANPGMEIIMMDLGLPDAPTPAEEIGKIKTATPNTLLVIFTGRPPADAAAFLAQGADAFIAKAEVTTATSMLDRLSALVREAVAKPGGAGRHTGLLEAVTRAVAEKIKGDSSAVALA